MLSLPDTLLLFALHDDKGTVHPSAFLSLDHGLRGALLAELRLRGCLRTWRNGTLTMDEGDAADPLLAKAHEVLRAALPGDATVMEALTALTGAFPDLRGRVIRRLEGASILVSSERTRSLLPGTKTHPMTDGTLEARALQRLRDALPQGADVAPRLGTLVALVEACGLIDVLFDDAEQDRAHDLAALVRQRDAIAEAVQEAAERTTGVWE